MSCGAFFPQAASAQVFVNCHSGVPQCSDRLDNDGDGRVDYSPSFGAGDPECVRGTDDNERVPGYQGSVCRFLHLDLVDRFIPEVPFPEPDCPFCPPDPSCLSCPPFGLILPDLGILLEIPVEELVRKVDSSWLVWAAPSLPEELGIKDDENLPNLHIAYVGASPLDQAEIRGILAFSEHHGLPQDTMFIARSLDTKTQKMRTDVGTLGGKRIEPF